MPHKNRKLQSVVAFPIKHLCNNSPLKVKDENNKQLKGQKRIAKNLPPGESAPSREKQMDSQNINSSPNSSNLMSTQCNSLDNKRIVITPRRNLEAYPPFIAKKDRAESNSVTSCEDMPDKKNDCSEDNINNNNKIFESPETSKVKLDSDTGSQVNKQAFNPLNISLPGETSVDENSISQGIPPNKALDNMDHKLKSIESPGVTNEKKSPRIISLKRIDTDPEDIANKRLERFSQSKDSGRCKRKRFDSIDKNKSPWSQVGEERINSGMSVSNYSLRTSHSTPKSCSSHSFHRSLHHSYSRQNRTPKADESPMSPFNSSESSQLRMKRLRTNVPYYNAEELQDLKSDVGVIDTHCHLDFLFQRQEFEGTYAKYQRLHKDSFPQCYEGCVAIFCDPLSIKEKSTWEDILKEDKVWAAFGCHPHMASFYDDDVEEALKDALCHPRAVAVGEMGLDYSERNSCPVAIQHEVFRKQLKIALRYKLPLVIHCREAYEDGLKIMKEIVPREYKIHLHCCTEKWENVNLWLDAFPNLYIGLTNIVSFPTAEEVHEVAQKIPLQRLLLETDTPYFLPRAMPRDMRWSHPGMVIHVAAQIAAFRKDDSIEEILKIVRENTNRMYGI